MAAVNINEHGSSCSVRNTLDIRTCDCTWMQHRGGVVRQAGEAVEAAIYKRQIEDAAKLVVRPGIDNRLFVYATALARSENDVMTWSLVPIVSGPHSGEWRHPESDTQGPLSEVLRSIACCYAVDPAPERID